ncbi:MAG TPA: type ISP restriction/modification enzyme [Gemmataceae bacterium]|nr:type ISP restriction/modification enzyme [Gemmataceae bacterium]
MARLAGRLRDTVFQALINGHPPAALQNLRNAHGVMGTWTADFEQLADVFAQTFVYGLFAARCNRLAQVAIPASDPFLGCLSETITAPEMARQPYAGLIADMVGLLEKIDPSALRQESDPIGAFYEPFLAAYNPQMRKAYGVYYTPAPIVAFMVRAVDDLLKLHFQVPDGLAENEVPPRVLILDPACGTGNFLAGVIAHVRTAFDAQVMRVGTCSQAVRRWLLPRLHGFEMLPTPYAISHLRLNSLFRSPNDHPRGNTCAGQQRLSLHLIRSFDDLAERATHLIEHLPGRFGGVDAKSKRDPPILVVLGNPPYRGSSAACGNWISQLLNDYRRIQGIPLGEKKVWLKNDYVQFLRLGQWCIDHMGRGVLAFITDHSYLDSPTFRGMRHELLKTFDDLYVLNLHGNAKRRERAPDGSKDDNVFAIQQGVAIALFVKTSERPVLGRVFYRDLWGSRQAKLDRLAIQGMQGTGWKRLMPALPGFELVPVHRNARAEYQQFWPVKDVFTAGSNGVQTSRDHLVVGFSRADLRHQIESFLAPEKSDQQIRQKFFRDKRVGQYPPGDTRQWQMGVARRALRQTSSWHRAIRPYLYRPLDRRYLLYNEAMIDWPRPDIMAHLQHPNYALCIGRAGLVRSGTWDLVFCVNQLCDHNLFYRGSSVNFPLYRYPKSGASPQPNLSASFTHTIAARLRLRWVADGPGDLTRTLGPESILHYAYALFHSPSYRRRYAESLKYDFPRLPLTAELALFRALCTRGEQLLGLHLLEKRPPASTTYLGTGDNTVQWIRYEEEACGSRRADRQGRVWINATQYFEGVPPEVWRFHIGGYRVCEKWLTDRKGRRLSRQDRACYSQIIGAMAASIGLMQEIDDVIDEQGGWPIQRTVSRSEGTTECETQVPNRKRI